ncbi:exosome complex RNA-binding protein Rrp4 [Sulfuracidifex metallicus DSM 6482 = JCM 9184]|jgi:exosome complex component RRP4|nr:exosome complex RNA-binding protein Rrp4 [Sulfuracidifex metallicus]MCY0849195.1 exosome complex RNA-binding protein Rrp4 [Sulfuracidifex metallicus]WOE51899.1 exosome complex RNA-binding protein Rrp4 [Sulfuracidifex metallicus DSM 6482 = JCM 9184]
MIVQPRAIVAPGDIIAEGEIKVGWSPYFLRVGDKYISTVVGMVNVKDSSFEVIPLEGSFYYPKVGDTVIALIKDIEPYGWSTDIKAPYSAYLPASSLLGRPVNSGEEIRKFMDIGDYVVAKVEAFDRTTDPILSLKGGKDLGRINSGIVIDFMPIKVARIIGKGRNMIETLSTETGCNIFVAQNGRLLANCPSKASEELLIFAIRKIEEESHIKGLTDKIKQLIREKAGGISASNAETKVNS